MLKYVHMPQITLWKSVEKKKRVPAQFAVKYTTQKQLTGLKTKHERLRDSKFLSQSGRRAFLPWIRASRMAFRLGLLEKGLLVRLSGGLGSFLNVPTQ